MNISYTGSGKVYLIAGGGKTYSDIAARFCNSERGVEEIIGSEESLQILHNLVNSNHTAALEFDDFIFGIEGYSRVTEAQLIRKRVGASYMIKSGRIEKHGKRSFDVVIPESIKDFNSVVKLNPDNLSLYLNTKRDPDGEDVTSVRSLRSTLEEYLPEHTTFDAVYYNYTALDILEMIENWYRIGSDEYNRKEEDLRYLKPQATEFKACIKMNAAGLRDWFQKRLCNRAQFEIRDLAWQMYKKCCRAVPALFDDAGAYCKVLGYCPENERQCSFMKGYIPTKEEAKKLLKDWKKLKVAEENKEE